MCWRTVSAAHVRMAWRPSGSFLRTRNCSGISQIFRTSSQHRVSQRDHHRSMRPNMQGSKLISSIDFKAPIFGLTGCIDSSGKHSVIAAGGGGSAKTGVTNKIVRALAVLKVCA